MSDKKKTLGPVSSRLLQELLKEGKRVFRSRDVCRILGKDAHDAADLLSEMVGRGVLFRIKPGLFFIVPLESAEGFIGNWYITAREMMDGKPYYIGYYSAMAIHGMATHPVKDVFVVSSARRQNREVAGVPFLFQYADPRKFFGAVNHWLTSSEQIRVSDSERTLIDCLSRPDLCGGVAEVAKGMWLKRQGLDWNKAVDDAIRFGAYAPAKRLGFLMEQLGFGSPEAIGRLKAFTDLSLAYVALDPTVGGGKDGFKSRWKIRVNFNVDEIKRALET